MVDSLTSLGAEVPFLFRPSLELKERTLPTRSDIETRVFFFLGCLVWFFVLFFFVFFFWWVVLLFSLQFCGVSRCQFVTVDLSLVEYHSSRVS